MNEEITTSITDFVLQLSNLCADIPGVIFPSQRTLFQTSKRRIKSFDLSVLTCLLIPSLLSELQGNTRAGSQLVWFNQFLAQYKELLGMLSSFDAHSVSVHTTPFPFLLLNSTFPCYSNTLSSSHSPGSCFFLQQDWWTVFLGMTFIHSQISQDLSWYGRAPSHTPRKEFFWMLQHWTPSAFKRNIKYLMSMR